MIRMEHADCLIPTHEGGGISSEIFFPRGGEVVQDKRLIIPITVTNSSKKAEECQDSVRLQHGTWGISLIMAVNEK